MDDMCGNINHMNVLAKCFPLVSAAGLLLLIHFCFLVRGKQRTAGFDIFSYNSETKQHSNVATHTICVTLQHTIKHKCLNVTKKAIHL